MFLVIFGVFGNGLICLGSFRFIQDSFGLFLEIFMEFQDFIEFFDVLMNLLGVYTMFLINLWSF